MHPLIPKVKVGDILLGTRNLRSYLRTVSVLECLNRLYTGLGKQQSRADLYTPSKAREYIVACNAWNMFGVWEQSSNVVVLFANPSTTGEPPLMDPKIFAHWFIRTKDKSLDRTSWPEHAINLWAFLHMNAISLPRNGQGFMLAERYNLPFTLADKLQQLDRTDHALNYVRGAIKRGYTRPSAPRIHFIRPPGRGIGPAWSRMSDYRQQIRELICNPRIRHRLHKDLGMDAKHFDAKYVYV